MRPGAVGRADRDDAVGISRIGDAESRVALKYAVLGLRTAGTPGFPPPRRRRCRSDQALAFVADRGAAAREIANIVRDRQTEIGAVDRDVLCRSFI